MFARRFLTLQKYAKYTVNPVLRRQMSDSHGGIPGQNLPFPKLIGNPTRCTVWFIVFFGSGIYVPCIAFIYMMHR